MESEDPDFCSRPGFFHLIPDLIEGKLHQNNVRYWYEKHQQEPDYLSSTSPERSAIENTIGVLKFVLEDKEKAIKYFEKLIVKTEKPSINTCANLQWLYEHDSPKPSEYQHTPPTWEDINITRGICEQGYFAGFYTIEEYHNTEHAKMALQLFEEGIRRGSEQGMDQKELRIWKYYRFRVKKYIYLGHLETEDRRKGFQNTVSAFLDFYPDAECDLSYYKANALMEVALMFAFDREHIEKQPGFFECCQQEGIVKDIWEDVERTCEKAMGMHSTNYSLPLKASKVYRKKQQFDKAQECISKSLELNKSNATAENSQMALYREMSRYYHLRGDECEAVKFLTKAYEYGKKIKGNFSSLRTNILIDMCLTCYHLFLFRGKQDFLEEAIKHGKEAKQYTNTNVARLYYCLALCFHKKQDIKQELEHLNKAVEYEKPGQTKHLLLYLDCLSEQHRKDCKDNSMVTKIADVLKNTYKKHPIDSMQDVYAKFSGKGFDRDNKLMKLVICKLSEGADSTGVLKTFCGVIGTDVDSPDWLKRDCQKYL